MAQYTTQQQNSNVNSVRKLHSYSVTEKEKNLIKKLRKAGHSSRKIAVVIGVSASTVEYHLNPARRLKYVMKYYNKNKQKVRKVQYAYMKKYVKRPEVKVKLTKYRREYEKRPYVRARKLAYAKKYYSNPKNRARRNAIQRARYAKNHNK